MHINDQKIKVRKKGNIYIYVFIYYIYIYIINIVYKQMHILKKKYDKKTVKYC